MPVDADRADALAHRVIRIIKTMRSLRQHLPKPAVGVDHATYPALFVLSNGPARTSALAEAIDSDISTVSRQVGQLLDSGLASRASDPDDGRAHLVHITDAGRAAVELVRTQRAEWFRDRLQDWSPAEVDDLTRALERFHHALLEHTPASTTAKDSA
ncbi:MarR family winged helix-turn-helix transcriptional regulator [Demetria terragena]|uniref:MarR family winged helix-turn-helix transcriptional regulator n=1 Tax=Demetria terragena TaxID=63959 RepID=UPI000371AAFB|nr:MarR family transcriptional regulator [Demetria terragena]